MPFPFHRLHVDLQKRLRALVTPSELYRLQIALGETQHYSRPLQLCYVPEGSPEFAYDQIWSGKWHLTLPRNYKKSYCKRSRLVLVKNLHVNSYFTEAASKTLCAHAIFDVWYLSVDSHLADAKMMVRLAALFSKSCTSMFFATVRQLPEISFQLIFYLFPHLDYLYIYVEGMENWLDDLLESKKTGLDSLRINLDLPDDLNELSYIKSKSMYDFCRAQPLGFRLELFFLTFPVGSCFPHKEAFDFMKPYFRLTHDSQNCNLVIGDCDEDNLYYCYA